jgi:hypothetical protein
MEDNSHSKHNVPSETLEETLPGFHLAFQFIHVHLPRLYLDITATHGSIASVKAICLPGHIFGSD